MISGRDIRQPLLDFGYFGLEDTIYFGFGSWGWAILIVIMICVVYKAHTIGVFCDIKPTKDHDGVLLQKPTCRLVCRMNRVFDAECT